MGEASFTDVWEAHAFCYGGGALQKGMMFAWSKWSAMLGEEIKRAQAASDPDTGETYYHHLLATLEHMVAEKGATSTQALT